MNLRLLFCVGMGVFTTYMGLVMLVVNLRTPVKYELPPKPNFKVRSAEVTDPATGEKIKYSEITVTTKLTVPEAAKPAFAVEPPTTKVEEPSAVDPASIKAPAPVEVPVAAVAAPVVVELPAAATVVLPAVGAPEAVEK